MIKAGIVGATGYVGEELIRILLNHKGVEISALSSASHGGEDIADIYPNLKNIISMCCTSDEEVVSKSDVVFTSLPYGLSEKIAEKCAEENKVCIDLGADFRLKNENDYTKWYGKNYEYPKLHENSVYGLPEVYRSKIKNSHIIGNPGCYPTSIILGLMPALKEDIVDVKTIIIDSKSGVTGSGKSLRESSHFPECNENLGPYKIAQHRHTPEIEQVLGDISEKNINITFVPYLIPVNRGILSTIYCSLNKEISIAEIHNIYDKYYCNEKFVRVLELGKTACIRNVKFSNYCDISLHKDDRTGRLIIVSTIDNMTKGSAGQAVQNMNIVLGFAEDEGLNLIPPAF